MNRREAQMIEPIKQLLNERMFVQITEREFSAGYGIADIVGAEFCGEGCRKREAMGLATPLDHIHFTSVLLSLHKKRWTSFSTLQNKVSVSETTLRQKILPRLIKLGIVEKHNVYFRLNIELPKTTQKLIAVEAKQTKWKEAILQARRYTFFAEQTYIAVWNDTARLVDRSLLYRHRLGLISVEGASAEVLVCAPQRKPRKPKLNLYCSEFFYGQALNQGKI